MPCPTRRCNAAPFRVEQLILVAGGVVRFGPNDGHVRSATPTHVVWSVGLTYRLHTERAIP